MTNYNILVCVHKNAYVRNDNIYTPIQVGKSLSKIQLGYIGDDTGNNISSKNKEYCELTAMYWAWKNLKDTDIIGLCHYRRYFNLNSSLFSTYLNEISEEQLKQYESSNEKERIEELLNRYDIILPKFWRTPWSIKRDFYSSICEQDFEILCRVIKKKYPEYFKTFERFCLGNRRTGCNMFITSKTIFNNYAEWLFNILFEVEKHVKISPYTYYQRIFGFMAEFLLPVYCIKNQLKIKECQMLFVSDQKQSPLILRTIKRKTKNIINNLSFKLTSITPEKLTLPEFWDNYLKSDNINI